MQRRTQERKKTGRVIGMDKVGVWGFTTFFSTKNS